MLHGPFKWNPFSATFKEYYYLFLKVLPEEIWNFVNFFSEEFIKRVRIALTADGKHLSKGDPHFRLNGTRNSNKKCYWWKFINMICTDVFNLKWLSESRTATRIITSSRAQTCVSPIPKKLSTLSIRDNHVAVRLPIRRSSHLSVHPHQTRMDFQTF